MLGALGACSLKPSVGNELLDCLKQRRGNKEETKEEEMDNLPGDAHEEEKVIRKERDKTKK